MLGLLLSDSNLFDAFVKGCRLCSAGRKTDR